MAVEKQPMFGQFKAEPLGDQPLPPFDILIAELLDPPAVQTQDMVMVLALIEFEHRLATLKMMAFDQPRRLELGQYPIHRRQTDILAGIRQHPVDHLSGEMRTIRMPQHFEDFHARQRDLQARLLEFFRAHAELSRDCASPRIAVVRYD